MTTTSGGLPTNDPDSADRSRRYGLREGAFQAVMQGGGENYLSAFALLLHASAWQIGLLSALPQVVGTWAQILSVKVLPYVRRRKTVILAGAAGQAALWLPLFALPLLFPDVGAWLLIACAVAYFGMGHFGVPAWNSLITDLVDPNQRGAYFARRAKYMALASFLTLCLAGLVLHYTETRHSPWIGFAVIFLLAAVARTISARYLSLLDDSASPATPEEGFDLGKLLGQAQGANFLRFLCFTGLMHACVLIAGPFFVIYLLRDLHFTYVQYGMWLAAGVLGQVLTLPFWGTYCDRHGTKSVMVLTGFLVPVLPMLYIFSTSLYALVAINFFGGMVWAGLALGLQNYVFDAVRPEDRAKGVAVCSTVNALGWFLGAMIGSWLATVAPSTLTLGELNLVLASNLPVVFFVSGVLRLVVSVSFLGKFGEIRAVNPMGLRQWLIELPLLKSLREPRPGRTLGRIPSRS